MKKTLIYFLLLFTPYIYSADINYKIEHINLEHGVSNNLIYSIYQDSKGFLWFGTMFGLVRYDGSNYKTFRYDPLDSNSLSNDDIISIFEDKAGNLWFGTYNGGLNKYDRANGVFTRYLHDKKNINSIGGNTVWDIAQDKDGVMWFATEGAGLNKFDDGKFTAYKKDTINPSGSISGNYIRSLLTDKEGNVWAGTIGSGLNKFDKGKNSFVNFRHDSKNPKSLGNNFVTSVFEDSDGELWVGTRGGGLNKLDKLSGDFTKFTNDSSGNNSISSNSIFDIKEESPGVLLIGTQKGLNKFDKSTGKFELIKIYPDDSKKKETILTFIKDKSGVLWVSSYLDGLHKLYKPPDKFQSMLSGNNVKCIYEDRSGKLWIGTAGNGLKRSDDGGESYKDYIYDKSSNSLSSNNVNSITEDNTGNIWLGTDKGLNKFDIKTGIFNHYNNDSAVQNSIASDNVLKVYFTRSGLLWIGTDYGLNLLDESKGNITHYQNFPEDTNSLSENSILSIYEDKNNVMWFGTFSGLNKLDMKSGKFKHYKQDPADPKSLSNNYVFSFCEDANNNFWIGTGGGLNILDRVTETFFHFTEKDGLPNGVIAGLEAGDNGELWISTFRGLSRFNVNKKEFRNYDTEDGLLSNMFNNGSYYKNHSGEIFFGGINGINYFYPSKVEESRYVPDVIFTSLTKYDGRVKKEIDLSSKEEVELSYKDNIINIGFASSDYTNPKKNKFSYKLEGFDQDWNSSAGINEAVYTNLDPGKYVFKVRGTNSDGIWNDKEASIKIIVSPPFWKTWWFVGVVIILLAALILLVQNLRVRAKVRHIVELEKIKETERELMREQASRDYHDELGHKLTRISLYSRRINKKLRPTANGLTEDLNSIVETSNSLQSGAKDLIWALNPKEDTLYDFTVRLRDFGNELFENTGINFSSDGIEAAYKDILLSMNCKRHMMYIFKEGMNNILKYSRCENVRLSFEINGDEMEVILKDDGKGFDPENCAKGYGLKNIFSRAKQINVYVNISSEKDRGTAIILKANMSSLVSV